MSRTYRLITAMKYSSIVCVLLLTSLNFLNAVHDSLNFILSPKSRQCFYEDFDSNSPAKTLEAFVQSGGNLDVKVIVHGPLDLDEIRTVIGSCYFRLIHSSLANAPKL